MSLDFRTCQNVSSGDEGAMVAQIAKSLFGVIFDRD
jgi:hypothetical protein